MAGKEKLSKEKGIEICTEFLHEGKTVKEILHILSQDYTVSRKTVYNWMLVARPEVEERQRKAKEIANDIYIAAVAEASKEAVMSELEAKKLTTDIARGNLADYMIIKTVEHRPRIEITLAEYIKQLTDEMLFEEEFAVLAVLADKELERHQDSQAGRERTILRHKLELKKNPLAKIVVDGPVEWKEVAELDLVKLVQDKEKGIIKSFQHTQFGVKVEMYSADAAQATILKLHGSFPPATIKNQHLGADGKPIDPPAAVTEHRVIIQDMSGQGYKPEIPGEGL